MLLKISKSLSEKINAKLLGKENKEAGPYQEWHGRLFRAKKEYIITTELFSMFSVIIEGAGIKNIETYFEKFTSILKNILKHYKIIEKYDIVQSQIDMGVFVSAENDRSFIASMNDLVINAKHQILRHGFDDISTSKYINEMPILSRDAGYAIELFGKIKI